MGPRKRTRVIPLIRLGLHNARRDAGTAVVLAAVVVLAAFGVSAAPRYVNAASDRALASAAEDASSLQRNISFNRLGRINATSDDDPFGKVAEQGDDLAATLTGELARSVDHASFAVTSPVFTVGEFPVVPDANVYRYFWFRYQDGAEAEIRVVEGSLPSPAEDLNTSLAECDDDGLPVEDLPTELCGEMDIPVFETALTAEVADWLDVEVGDEVLLQPIADTAGNRGLPLAAFDQQIIMQITGIVDLGDQTDDIWLGQTMLHQPIVSPRPIDGYDVLAMGLLAAKDYERLVDETLPARFSYDWRFFVDYESLDSSNIEAAASDVASLGLLYEANTGVEDPKLSTSIDDIVTRYRGQRTLAVTYSSLVLVGLTGLAVAVVIVLAALASKRRENNTILVRTRGASSVPLALARFGEGLIVFIPSALIGLLLATVLIEGTPSKAPVWVALGVAVLFSAVFTLLAVPTVAGDLGGLMTGRTRHASAVRRLVVEVTIVALATGSVVLLRRRGLTTPVTGFDPLLAAAPLLVSTAAGVLLLRLAPFAARFASTIGSKARGVVGLIGFKSMAKRPMAAQLPAVVMLIGIGVAVFGTVLGNTITTTQVEGSWQSVGANYRIEPSADDSRISPQLTLDQVDGVEATADAVLLRAQVNEDSSNLGNIQLLGVDLDDYGAVAAGTPADPRFGENMTGERSSEDVGTESNPLPIIASRDWPVSAPRVGQTWTLSLDHRFIVVVVEEVRDIFPGLDLDQSFAVADREALGLVNEAFDVSPNRRYVRAPDAISEALEESLAGQLRGVRLISRPETLSEIQTAPTVTTVETINRSSLWVAIALSVIAVLAGFALTSKERTRDIGYLRAVGLTKNQMTWLTFTEQLPPATLAAAIGVGVGVAIAFLLSPSLDLAPLTGTTLDLGPVIDWAPVLTVALGILGTVIAATAIYSYMNREMDLAGVLRRGDRL